MHVLGLLLLGLYIGLQPKNKKKVDIITSPEGMEILGAFYTCSEAVTQELNPNNMKMLQAAHRHVTDSKQISKRNKLDVDITYNEILYHLNLQIAQQFREDVERFRKQDVIELNEEHVSEVVFKDSN